MQRRLLSTRRLIPLDRLDEYLAGWNDVRRAAIRAGAHAWLFRAASRQDHFLEFIEYGEAPGAIDSADLAGARTSLDELFGAGQTEEWEDLATSANGVL